MSMDPIERILDNTVQNMSASELSAYMKRYIRERYQIDLPTDDTIDRKTLEAFQRRYPDGVAGRILQHVMLIHGGKKDGRIVTSSIFSTKMKWWTDMMYLEMQQAEQRKAGTSRDDAAVKGRFFDLGALG